MFLLPRVCPMRRAGVGLGVIVWLLMYRTKSPYCHRVNPGALGVYRDAEV